MRVGTSTQPVIVPHQIHSNFHRSLMAIGIGDVGRDNGDEQHGRSFKWFWRITRAGRLHVRVCYQNMWLRVLR